MGSRVVGSEDPRPVVELLEALPVPAQTWSDLGADVVRYGGFSRGSDSTQARPASAAAQCRRRTAQDRAVPRRRSGCGFRRRRGARRSRRHQPTPAGTYVPVVSLSTVRRTARSTALPAADSTESTPYDSTIVSTPWLHAVGTAEQTATAASLRTHRCSLAAYGFRPHVRAYRTYSHDGAAPCESARCAASCRNAHTASSSRLYLQGHNAMGPRPMPTPWPQRHGMARPRPWQGRSLVEVSGPCLSIGRCPFQLALR